MRIIPMYIRMRCGGCALAVAFRMDLITENKSVSKLTLIKQKTYGLCVHFEYVRIISIKNFLPIQYIRIFCKIFANVNSKLNGCSIIITLQNPVY